MGMAASLIDTMTIKTVSRLANTMPVRVRTALKNGISRAFTRNGVVLIGAYLASSLLQRGLYYVVTTIALPFDTPADSFIQGQAMTVGLSPGSQLSAFVAFLAGLIVMFLGGWLTVPVQVIALRIFVGEITDEIPEKFVYHRLGWQRSTASSGPGW